ncbi:MAG TPA: nuclear transport factor 2 family protein [Solirubrobacterales bacterium]
MATSPDTDQRLADREAIRELLFEYCRACDVNDPEAVAACFTEDCRADYGPDARTLGAEARRVQAEDDLGLFEATSHLLGNVSIEFDGPDRARAASVVHAWHRPRRGEPWSLHARYEDVLVRAPEGWLIDERRLLVAGTQPRQEGWKFNPLPRSG